MNERAHAEEHLRVIRSLMERATVYRAISGPTAVLGGAMSLVISTFLLLAKSDRGGASIINLANPGAARHFIAIWSLVLLVTLLGNTFFIWRKATREGGPFMTSGLRLAIKSALPILIVAGVLTALFWRDDETAEAVPILAILWITCYGLALLATGHFAPGSLRLLGWAFLITGVVCTLLTGRLFYAEPANSAVIAMAVTFGLYHLVYGAATWPRKSDPA